ncbi:hypothetical protein BKA70DRAFT_1398678 [Coprinopsis sp. MPI-PUGE-AT-0042]|nr:hypothetical protein BKA70DRAFT_1398678 [Coprinopsis sp. MPI-PUGE-AT-0042]
MMTTILRLVLSNEYTFFVFTLPHAIRGLADLAQVVFGSHTRSPKLPGFSVTQVFKKSRRVRLMQSSCQRLQVPTKRPNCCVGSYAPRPPGLGLVGRRFGNLLVYLFGEVTCFLLIRTFGRRTTFDTGVWALAANALSSARKPNHYYPTCSSAGWSPKLAPSTLRRSPKRRRGALVSSSLKSPRITFIRLLSVEKAPVTVAHYTLTSASTVMLVRSSVQLPIWRVSLVGGQRSGLEPQTGA